MNPFMPNMIPQYQYHLRKYLYDILKERYAKHEKFIDKLAETIEKPEDVDAIAKFVVEIYEMAYIKSIHDNQQALEDRGFKAIIKAEITQEMIDAQRIFPKNEEFKKPTIFSQ